MNYSHLFQNNLPIADFILKSENLLGSNKNENQPGHLNLNMGLPKDYGAYQNDIDESHDDSKTRNRRRSKNDNDGRSHRCTACGKGYLSYPALYTHIKTKHETQGSNGNKGRGRPKKENSETESIKNLYSPSTFDYFKNPERNGETDNDIRTLCKTVFEDLYTMSLTMLCKEKYSGANLDNNNINLSTHFNNDSNEKVSMSTNEFFRIIEKCKNMENYAFYVKMVHFFENPQSVDENAPCDDVFFSYLFKVSKLVRGQYFIIVLKFITLFREFVNLTYKKKSINGVPFTETTNPEDVPDISNEFIIDFLGTEDLLFGYSREEGIELTQNLCMWLYDNNYTCSKISLISGYN